MRSLDANEGEFDLLLSARSRQADAIAYACDRYSHFCPTETGSVYNASVALRSSAAASAPRPHAYGTALVALLCVLRGWRRS